LRKDKLVSLEKSQYTVAFLFFIMGVTLLQATINAITPGFTLLVLDTILLINNQIAVRIWYGVMAFITLNLT